MPRSFKTVRGEVYGRCGLTFDHEPKAVDDETLAVMTVRDGVERTIERRLLEDPRLVEVDPPAGHSKTDDTTEPKAGGKPGKPGKSGKGGR